VVSVGDAPEGIVYDARTGLVAVAVRDPDRLVLLDGQTLQITAEIPLAGHARHLQLVAPGGPVLVPEEDRNQLAVIALPTGSSPARTTLIRTGTSPHDATAVSGGYVTGNEFGRSITIARSGRAPQTVGGVEQPGGVIGLGDRVAVVDVKAYTLSTFAVDDGRRLALVDAGAGPTHGVRAADGSLLVADTRGNAVLTFDSGSLALRGHLALPGSPYGLAADPDHPLVWVTLTGRNQVVGIDVTGPRVVARLATVAQPDSVAVAPGSHTIWIAGQRAGVVQKLTR